MAGWHVVGGGRVLAVAARPHVHGDPLAFHDDLHGATGEPHLDLIAREAIGKAVEVALDLDAVIDPDRAQAPLVRRGTRSSRKRVGVSTDPIPERLRPGRLDVSEVRGVHHRDEVLRLIYQCRIARNSCQSSDNGIYSKFRIKANVTRLSEIANLRSKTRRPCTIALQVSKSISTS
jgi:hypothetical protein